MLRKLNCMYTIVAKTDRVKERSKLPRFAATFSWQIFLHFATKVCVSILATKQIVANTCLLKKKN